MAGRQLPGLGLTGDWALGEDNWKDENDLNLLTLSTLVQARVLGIMAAEPTEPTQGMVYLLNDAHATHANAIAIYDDGAWRYIPAFEGLSVFNTADSKRYEFKAGAWAEIASGGGGGGGIEEAPADGKLYGRKDEAWSEVPSGGGGGGGGAGDWELVRTYDASVHGGASGEIIIAYLADYSDIIVQAHDLVSSALITPAVYFSTDNGWSFWGSPGQYKTSNVNGVAVNDSFNVFLHGGSQSTHNARMTIEGNIAGTPKTGVCTNGTQTYIFTGSTDVISAIKIKTRATTPVPFSSGKVHVWGRRRPAA